MCISRKKISLNLQSSYKLLKLNSLYEFKFNDNNCFKENAYKTMIRLFYILKKLWWGCNGLQRIQFACLSGGPCPIYTGFLLVSWQINCYLFGLLGNKEHWKKSLNLAIVFSYKNASNVHTSEANIILGIKFPRLKFFRSSYLHIFCIWFNS